MLPVHDAQRRNVIRKYGLWHESSRLKGLARQVHLQRSSVRREFGVVGGVLVRVERLVLAEEDVPRGHHLEVVFQRRRLAVHHKAVLAQLRLAHAPAGAQPIPVPSRHPAPVAHRVGHQQPLGAVLAGRDEEERVDVVRHIHQQRVEGVHAGLSRYAKRAGDARDRHLARDAAPLARDVRQVSLRVPTELMLVHIHRIMKERDDLIRGALPRVLLVRMCVVCTIDSYGGEGTDVLVEAKRTRCWLRAVYTCDIDSLGEYIVTADSFIHAVPNREQLLRPRTPRGAKGNEHELTPRHKSGEVAGPSRRLRVLRLSGRLALIARLSALGAHKGGVGDALPLLCP
mmetsp:Transcript_36684/g.117842  ORF Transcript_36684/g.117842 Transcript_36684/m.117842 type:complete len:342 (-) Transcript_36684:502-1527(-)